MLLPLSLLLPLLLLLLLPLVLLLLVPDRVGGVP